jgi:hypothetical protein
MTANMDTLQILLHDSIHNQKDTTFDEMVEAQESLVEEGFQQLRQNNTLFMAKQEGDVVFYHTANADPMTKYVNNLNSFYTLLKLKGFRAAYTTLENPKLSSLVKRYFKDNTVIIEDKAVTFLV